VVDSEETESGTRPASRLHRSSESLLEFADCIDNWLRRLDSAAIPEQHWLISTIINLSKAKYVKSSPSHMGP